MQRYQINMIYIEKHHYVAVKNFTLVSCLTLDATNIIYIYIYINIYIHIFIYIHIYLENYLQ